MKLTAENDAARPVCSCCDAWLDGAGNCPSRRECCARTDSVLPPGTGAPSEQAGDQ